MLFWWPEAWSRSLHQACHSLKHHSCLLPRWKWTCTEQGTSPDPACCQSSMESAKPTHNVAALVLAEIFWNSIWRKHRCPRMINESRGGRVALSLLSQWVIVLGNEVESHWWLRTQATWSSLWDSLRSWILSCLASVSAKRCQFSLVLHVFPWFWNSPWHIQAVTAKEPCCPEESSFQFSISKFVMSSTRK